MFRQGTGVKRMLEADEQHRRQIVPRQVGATGQDVVEVANGVAASAPPSSEEEEEELLDEVEEVAPVTIPLDLSRGQVVAFIKKEQEDSALRGERSAFASEHEAKRRAKLVEPDGKTPRKVFRRGDYLNRESGVKGMSIHTVLGGNPMDPWPMVTEGRRPWLKPGECFVAGNAGWASFAPAYAGANGLIDMEACEAMHPEQETFHFFRQLPKSRHAFPLTAYHGKLAKDGYLYLGEYRVPELDEITFINFNEHPFLTQYTMVEGYTRVGKERAEQEFYADATVPPYTCRDHTRCMYAKTTQEANAVEQVKTVRDDKGTDADTGEPLDFAGYRKLHKNTLIHDDHQLALLRKYRTENPLFAYALVECVGYDEKLYEALVKAGAQGTTKGQGKRVSLDPTDLARL